MSTPRVSQVFSLLHPGPAQRSSGAFEELIRKCNEEALASYPAPPETGFFLKDIGNYIMHTNKVVSLITEKLVDGHHIKSGVPGVWDEAERQTGLADMSNVEYIERTHLALTEMRRVMKDSLDEISGIWNNAPTAPMKRSQVLRMPCAMPAPMEMSPSVRSPFSTSSSTSTGTMFPYVKEEPQVSPMAVSPRGLPSPNLGDSSASSSPQSISARVGLDDIDIEALRTRGKSTYKCSYGYKCTKGGIDKSGNLVTFERNCMIRQHMEKHSKPYRCNLPGCPNKVGFARKDQLERHLKLVKH